MSQNPSKLNRHWEAYSKKASLSDETDSCRVEQKLLDASEVPKLEKRWSCETESVFLYLINRVVIDPATIWYNNKFFLCSVCKSPQDWRDCTKQLCKLGSEHEGELLGLCEICYLGNSEANWCLYRWTLNSVKSMQLKLTTTQLSRQWFWQYTNKLLIKVSTLKL